MLSISPKYSGGSIKARVTVEPVDDTVINMRLADIKTKMFNEEVMQEMVVADPGEEVAVLDVEHLEKPIQMKMVDGKVESVSIAKDEPLWTVNFKRALAAQIQLQLDVKSSIFRERHHAAYYAENSVYHTMEVRDFFFLKSALIVLSIAKTKQIYILKAFGVMNE